jgi:hypothetical protein
MNLRRHQIFCVALLFGLFSNLFDFSGRAALVRAQSPLQADLALVLSIDCSYSVDEREFNLQTAGTAWAFLQPEILEAIQTGRHKRIAVSLVQWSSEQKQVLALPWMIVSSAEDAQLLARKIEVMPRYFADGSTSISGALRFAAGVLSNAPVRVDRQTIDISADGRNNAGTRTKPMRDQLIDLGIVINGLAILNEVPTLNYYFERDVIGGLGSFVIAAKNYEDFRRAIHRKLMREITGPGMS